MLATLTKQEAQRCLVGISCFGWCGVSLVTSNLSFIFGRDSNVLTRVFGTDIHVATKLYSFGSRVLISSSSAALSVSSLRGKPRSCSPLMLAYSVSSLVIMV